MSPGAIAMTAILVSGGDALALIAAGTWLVYSKRIVLAATPKPTAQAPAANGADPARSAT
jgi:hypothetical protein